MYNSKLLWYTRGAMMPRSNDAITQRIQRRFTRDFPLRRGLLSAALQSEQTALPAQNIKRPRAIVMHQSSTRSNGRSYVE